MKAFKDKRKRNIIIVAVTLLLIGIGYAFLTSDLNILGNSIFKNNTWGVEFENINTTPGSISPSTAPTISNKTTINYSVQLNTPGDFYEFTVDAVNKGSIDAMIDSVETTGLTTAQKKYIEYSATYDSGVEIKAKQKLDANDKEKIRITVKYKKEITASDLPSTDEVLNLSLTIHYIQKDDNAVAIVHPTCKRATALHKETCNNISQYACGYYGTYTNNSNEYKQGDTITYGSLGTTGTLSSGDAFDCDVNGDGEYNSETERFYYVSDLDTNSNYGVLIYYNNVSGGEPDNTAISAYDSANKPTENGPITAKIQLPKSKLEIQHPEWRSISLSNSTRKIKDEAGAEYMDFDYSPYAARLLTYQEVVSACGSGDPSSNGYLVGCQYLLENTKYSNSSLQSVGYWLETIKSSSSSPITGVWYISAESRKISYFHANYYESLGVRPAIEVKK